METRFSRGMNILKAFPGDVRLSIRQARFSPGIPDARERWFYKCSPPDCLNAFLRRPILNRHNAFVYAAGFGITYWQSSVWLLS